jgi:hypothetical protein
MKIVHAQLIGTIDVKALTFADWLSISAHCENSAIWGWNKWLDSSPDLKVLTLEDWESIANQIGWSEVWAYKQWKANRV